MTKAETIEKLKTPPAPEAFDFDTLDLLEATDKPFEFELVRPDTSEGIGVFVSVVGAESQTFQTYMREETNHTRREAFKAQRKGKDVEPSTAEEDEDRLLRAVAACMTGWRTVIDGKSEPVIVWAGDRLEFSRENAVRWMKRFRWVRAQVNEATADLTNFIKD